MTTLMWDHVIWKNALLLAKKTSVQHGLCLPNPGIKIGKRQSSYSYQYEAYGWSLWFQITWISKSYKSMSSRTADTKFWPK